MKRRCLTPTNGAYHKYGAKGITVCKEWYDFLPFYEWAITHGYERGLLLDRQDGTKGYSPDNCRFVTSTVSNKNRKISHVDRFLQRKS